MNTQTIRLSLLSLLVAGLASADLHIEGPLAGYSTDASRSHLRAIRGVPGAFTFSEVLPLPDGAGQIRLGPRQDYALAELANQGTAIVLLKDGAADVPMVIDGAMPSADWTAFSLSAGSVMLFSAGAHRLQVLSGLPSAPRVTLDLDSSTLPETPILGAVNDDGSLVMVASAAALYHVNSSGAQLLLSAGDIRSLTILRNGSDAAVAAGGAIHVVRDAGTRVLATGLDGAGPIYPGTDGQSLYAAIPAASSIVSIDLASGEVRSFASSLAPDGLAALRNADTFLVSAADGAPGLIFYRDGADARLVYIPAVEGGIQ